MARRCLVDALAGNVMEVDDRAGLPNALWAVPGHPESGDPKTVMGFCGKALESAEFLIPPRAVRGCADWARKSSRRFCA